MENMSDDVLIQRVAELWVENGGDAEGYDYCIRKIRDAIDKLTDEGDVHDGRDDLAVNRSLQSAQHQRRVLIRPDNVNY